MFENGILESDRKLAIKQGISTIPSVVIGGDLYQGRVGAESVENIVEAICDKMEVRPSECTTWRSKKVDKEYDLDLISWATSWILGWLVAICFFMCFGLISCKSRLMREHVSIKYT